MEVEEASRLRAGVTEAVNGPGRRGDEGPGPADAWLVAGEKLDLALDHVEAVGVVVVSVGVDAFELRAEGHVDRGQLREVAEDPVCARLVLERLRSGEAGEHGVRERATSVGRRLVLVEAALPEAAQHVAEARGRRVHVEEERGRVARVAEGVDDIGRRSSKVATGRAHRLLLGAERELELPFEHVERVRVVVMDVRVGACFTWLVAEPGDDQRLELGEDPERPLGPVRGRLALAGR